MKIKIKSMSSLGCSTQPTTDCFFLKLSLPTLYHYITKSYIRYIAPYPLCFSLVVLTPFPSLFEKDSLSVGRQWICFLGEPQEVTKLPTESIADL